MLIRFPIELATDGIPEVTAVLIVSVTFCTNVIFFTGNIGAVAVAPRCSRIPLLLPGVEYGPARLSILYPGTYTPALGTLVHLRR